jgi:hypothetical protein
VLACVFMRYCGVYLHSDNGYHATEAWIPRTTREIDSKRAGASKKNRVS